MSRKPVSEAAVRARIEKMFAPHIGTTITKITTATPEEIRALSLDDVCPPGMDVLLIFLSNGCVLVPMADPEGNGPGWLDIADIIDTSPSS